MRYSDTRAQTEDLATCARWNPRRRVAIARDFASACDAPIWGEYANGHPTSFDIPAIGQRARSTAPSSVTGCRRRSRRRCTTCVPALSNVTKHADASHVRVTVRVNNSTVTAAVEDDGIGGADPALCSGLLGLADRVDATGGRLERDITSR